VGAHIGLAGILQMVEQTQRLRAPMQRRADLVAGYLVVCVTTISFLAFISWGIFAPSAAAEWNWV